MRPGVALDQPEHALHRLYGEFEPRPRRQPEAHLHLGLTGLGAREDVGPEPGREEPEQRGAHEQVPQEHAFAPLHQRLKIAAIGALQPHDQPRIVLGGLPGMMPAPERPH